MSSALIQVTVVPALTVKAGGSKVKFAILTWASTARAGGAVLARTTAAASIARNPRATTLSESDFAMPLTPRASCR